MTAVAFDTLKFARSLREKVKLSTEQAEGMADAMAEVLQGDIATKADLGEVRKDIEGVRLATKADIEALRLSTKTDAADLRKDMEALRLSTKADLADVRKDIEALRLSTKADIEASKAEIMKWMFGTVGFQTLLIIGAVIALARNLH